MKQFAVRYLNKWIDLKPNVLGMVGFIILKRQASFDKFI